MGNKNPDIDRYIRDAPEFAQPILKRLRSAFHKGCPQVEETIKWGIPTFQYHGILGSIAAFKRHVSLGFWRSKEMQDPANLLQRRAASMSNVKFSSMREIPKIAVLAEYVAQAAQLNLDYTARPKKKVQNKKLPPIPQEFQAALENHSVAKTQFACMPPGKRRDYIEWIADAKRPDTMLRRIATAIQWIAEGKGRNWKYESNCQSKRSTPQSKSRDSTTRSKTPKARTTSEVPTSKTEVKPKAKKRSAR